MRREAGAEMMGAWDSQQVGTLTCSDPPSLFTSEMAGEKQKMKKLR